MTHGTLYAYRQGCSCEQCREVNAAKRRQQRQRSRARAEAAGTLPAPVKPGPKPVVRFEHDLVNLAHALTLEDWQAREAADPSCRPVTQPPIRLRRESIPDPADRLSVVDAVIAEVGRD